MTPKGTLIVIGGNEQKELKRIDERFHSDFGEGFILQEVINLAGGADCRIEIITSASDIPIVVGEKYQKTFAKLGAENVGILNIYERAAADFPEVLKRVANTDAVMFSGGDQNQISRIIKDTNTHKIICDRYLNEKFILAGTSAGAVAMSQEMIAGGKTSNILRKNALKMGKGLGVIPEVIFDSHFIRRGRFGGLAEAVAAYPDKLGIGLGEDTGLIIRAGNIGEIIGTGMVILFDGSNLTYNNYPNLKDQASISLANLNVHVLAPGDKYYIKEKKAVIYVHPESNKELNKFE